MTDRQLLERFVTGNDPDAFTTLIERHGPMVLGVCRSVLRDPHDVEDTFQGTFLILARKAGTIKDRDSVAAWLHRVAFRVARRARSRSWQRRTREGVDAGSVPEPAFEPPDSSLGPLLRDEMSLLPDRYRLPLELCYLEGKSNKEAAIQLRCPVGTVKGRLSRARGRLRDRLVRRGLYVLRGHPGASP
jgi:RNA polymerase sigma factor (sigma-70 family)